MYADVDFLVLGLWRIRALGRGGARAEEEPVDTLDCVSGFCNSNDLVSVEGVVDPVRVGEVIGDPFKALCARFSFCVTASEAMRKPPARGLEKKENE